MRGVLARARDWLGPDAWRAAILFAVCAFTAVLVVDWTRVPREELQAGDVAPRTVEAPFTFRYQDYSAREQRQSEARESVPSVYVYRADLAGRLQERIGASYAGARQELVSVLDARGVEAPEELETIPEAVLDRFRTPLGVHVPDDVLLPLARAGFPHEAESLSRELLGQAMDGPIISDKELLPPPPERLTILSADGAQRSERIVASHDGIGTPATARERLSLGLLDRPVTARPWTDAAVSVARASIRPNLDYDHLETEERRDRAAAAVPMAPVTVKKGTTLFRQGDVLTQLDTVRYEALQSSRAEQGVGLQLLAVGLFLLLLLVSLYHFGASYLQNFSTRVRDIAAVGTLLVVTTLLARTVVELSGGIAALLGSGAEAETVWFVVPVAGAAMLVRLLVGVSWTTVFAVATAATCGLVMELDALYVVFFLLSAIAAAGAVEHTRERLAVLRAGLVTGLINAATVLLIHFLQLFLADGELTTAAAMRPVWTMGFAFLGGILSSFMVLALVPLFEMVGFVTDYRLMELANLNHPLLRQLMLRAPGSYHHSVIVGSLSEAAAESVGANALQARVAAYFHDVGKAVKPQYFVENQRDGVNGHDRIDATTSARIIIDHVVDGGRMAKEHNLPKPIVDNIYMHHGTGLLQYFYAQALEEADDPSAVDEADFRYPGPRPNTREAGIIMLADKIEAATRTIRAPTEANIRQMIEKIINSVMADGQFEECPLTFQEMYTIADTFVQVLLGIYHHRIEYPDTAEISQGTGKPAPPRPSSIITLEIPGQTVREVHAPAEPGALGESDDPTDDYEAVENLPRGG